MAKKKNALLTCALIGVGVGAAVTAAVIAKKKIDAMSDEEIGDCKFLRAVKDFDISKYIPCSCCCDGECDCCCEDDDDCCCDGDSCCCGETDAAFVDTTGNGKIDTVFVDTTGDGKLDTAIVDLDGDGKMDVKITEDSVEQLPQ